VENQTSGFYGADGALHNYDLAKNRIWSRFEVMNSQILAEVGRATESENEIDGKLTREKELIYTRITQTAEAITSEANRATQVESQLGNEISTVNTTLSSRITQTAEDITSEVTRATAAETQISGNLTTLNENLSSRITQNASSITAEVTRASTAETRIDGRITTEVTDIGSRISMESDRISLVVSGSGAYAAINVEGIVNKVNSSQVTIDADRVDINGSVVVSQLRDDFDNLTDGTLWADTLAADTVWATGLHVTTAMGFCNQVVGYADVTINGTNYRVMTLT